MRKIKITFFTCLLGSSLIFFVTTALGSTNIDQKIDGEVTSDGEVYSTIHLNSNINKNIMKLLPANAKAATLKKFEEDFSTIETASKIQMTLNLQFDNNSETIQTNAVGSIKIDQRSYGYKGKRKIAPTYMEMGACCII